MDYYHIGDRAAHDALMGIVNSCGVDIVHDIYLYDVNEQLAEAGHFAWPACVSRARLADGGEGICIGITEDILTLVTHGDPYDMVPYFILHEVGHVVNGHCNGIANNYVEQVTSEYHDGKEAFEAEKAADDFAIGWLGPVAVVNALTTTVDLLSKVIDKFPGINLSIMMDQFNDRAISIKERYGV